jgi:hypothetical protein
VKQQDERTPSADYEAVVSMYASEAETWKGAVGDLRKRAGAAYAAKRDVEARLLRDLADEWEPRVAAARKKQAEYERAYRPESE